MKVWNRRAGFETKGQEDLCTNQGVMYRQWQEFGNKWRCIGFHTLYCPIQTQYEMNSVRLPVPSSPATVNGHHRLLWVRYVKEYIISSELNILCSVIALTA